MFVCVTLVLVLLQFSHSRLVVKAASPLKETHENLAFEMCNIILIGVEI